MPYELIEGEQVISKSQKGTITLTNYRIKSRTSSSSKADSISIMLEKVSSIQVLYKSKPLYLIIGIVVLLFGLYLSGIGGGYSSGDTDMIKFGLIGLGVLFLLIYFFSRKHVMEIASDGGASIIFHTAGMKRDDLDHFIEQIEAAKHKRFLK